MALTLPLSLPQGANADTIKSAAARTIAQQQSPAPSAQTNVPANGPTLLRSDFLQLMDADFRKRDLDGNGKANRAEIEEFTKRDAALKARQQNEALFLRLDTDKNGVLTPAEFNGLIPAAKFVDVSAELNRYDSNRDQVVTLVEYRIATLVNFDRMDKDKDGVLSAAELSTVTAAPPSPTIER